MGEWGHLIPGTNLDMFIDVRRIKFAEKGEKRYVIGYQSNPFGSLTDASGGADRNLCVKSPDNTIFQVPHSIICQNLGLLV